ncbi:predicted protein [Uncinocarpus reesii 1704]|uniref:DNA repair protein rhp41 n=1 Tax=Uncinocarpus reesii (strain UAMH 1704) TaxID=336963 RepID=C4JHD4_UNCRE|nr:uncharacterized protein UREG_01297 [Uncinocarpus reesii 1704]EEP76448.1 predicted protein [Uncinocarpus reesii 1704]
MGKRTAPSRGTRQAGKGVGSEAPADDSIADIYRDMLVEAHPTINQLPNDVRATKRRRVGERSTPASDPQPVPQDPAVAVERTVGKAPQTVYDIDASDESEVDDWEDVEPPSVLPIQESSPSASANRQDDVELQITLEKPEVKDKQKASSRRKPVSGAEKRCRLDIHKLHLLCLLGHVQMRNSWCNDSKAQGSLRRLLSKRIILLLHPKTDMPQFNRSTTFADGLKQASDTFRRRFKPTALGMRRPFWLDNLDTIQSSITIPDSTEILLSKEDFRKHAISMEGSRDLGAQLFCTMLRAVGVDTRLVCSLQPLPFSGVAKGEAPMKSAREYIILPDDNERASSETSGNSALDTPKAKDTPPQRMRRFGQPRFSPGPSKSPKPKSAPVYSPVASESLYPIFWVEAFNEAMQKWVVVDPIVTNTLGKPARFEPPASDRYNNMSYVLAFEDDGSARDVTKRYVKSFNAKTRKARVESTKNGESWWERTMQSLEKPFLDDRDQLEIGELTAKAAAEGMPRNVQDFKNHPIYALERHLRRNEVIHPKREIGKVGLSRCIKASEQPLKRVPTSNNKVKLDTNNDDDAETTQETPMYAVFQTEIYKPSPIVENRVPKNVYGNIDVYVPSMVPEGGFHLKHNDAARAAKILGIDFADAVTGFRFQGRHGTAVIEGIVASVQYREAILAIISGLEDERMQAEQDRRTMAALQMWRQLLLKLRIAERVQSYAFEGENDETTRHENDLSESDVEETGGGFFPEVDNEAGEPSTAVDQESSVRNSTIGDAVNDTSRLHQPRDSGFIAPELSSTAISTSCGTSSMIPRAGFPRTASQSQYRLVVVPAGTLPLSGSLSNPVPAPAAQQCQVQEDPQISASSPVNELPLHSMRDTSGISRSASAEELAALPDLVHNDSDSEIDDQNSMISHDPEDEDAEPEWLLSD